MLTEITYKHTQIGYLIVGVLLAVMLLFGFILMQPGVDLSILAAMLFILFILAAFGSLIVEVDENYLRIKFGFGLIRIHFPLKNIVSARSVRNHWYYGWGIRLWLWPRMVIFSVSGFDAVEIRMKNGRTFRIGTDEPECLERAIAQATKLKRY